MIGKWSEMCWDVPAERTDLNKFRERGTWGSGEVFAVEDVAHAGVVEDGAEGFGDQRGDG